MKQENWTEIRKEKQRVLDDMPASIRHTPSRETDLLAFMCQYIKEDAERRPAILEQLRCCMDGKPYSNPYLGQCGYTQAEVEWCSARVEEYLTTLQTCSGEQEEIEQAVQKVLEQLDRLNERCSYALIDDWRRERLCRVISDAADLAAAPYQQQEMG